MQVSYFARDGLSPADALAMGDACLDWTDEQRTAVVFVAALKERALVVGAWERMAAVSTSQPKLRRRTGGAPCLAGDGITYVAIALAHASALLQCPPDKVLNRNVRGILAGLRRAGFAAHYFGRDFVSVDRRPAGMLSWTRTLEGRVLVEAFLHAERSCLPEAVARRSGPSWLGKPTITLAEAGRLPSPAELAEHIALGCAALGAHEIGVLEPPSRPQAVRAAGPPELAHWSARHEIPIGWCWAGMDQDGSRVGAVALAGDFDQDEAAPARLSAQLVGRRFSPEAARDAINETYGPNRCALEGLSSLQPLLDALIESYSASRP